MRAEAVRQALERRGLTRHGAHTMLDISREAVSKMWDGRAVSLETVEKFARAMRLDVNEWRERWGFERLDTGTPYSAGSLNEERETYRMLPPEEEESGRRILLEGIVALKEKHRRPIPISLDESDLAALTPEKARATLKFWDEQAEQGII